MPIHYLNSIDLNKNELIHAVIENQPSDALAGTGVDGQLYFNDQEGVLKIWKNGGWTEVDDFTIGLSFNTSNGVLTATVQNENDVTVDLDGRYALIGDIPTVNDAPLTVQGTGVLSGSGTFTANDADNVTISISHDNTSRTDTTSSDNPGYGGTFEAVTGVTTNATGHVTAIDVSTVTIPASDDTTYDISAVLDTVATISLNGSDGSADAVKITGTANEVETSVQSASEIKIGLPDDVTIAGDLTVSGNLTVSGGVTTKLSETVNIEDNLILLNSNEDASPTENAGIEVERGTDTNVSLLWNEASDPPRWTFTNDGTNYHNIPVPSEYDNFSFRVGAGGTSQEVSNGGVVNFTSLGGLVVSVGGDDEITFSHAGTSTQASVDNSGLTVIQDVTLDVYGHVTGLGSSDITSEVNTLIDNKINATGYAATITDSVSGTTFNHGLGDDVIVQLYDATTKETVYADVERNGDYLNITFASTPTNSVRVLVQKIN